jgi:hypothetical protein
MQHAKQVQHQGAAVKAQAFNAIPCCWVRQIAALQELHCGSARCPSQRRRFFET